MAKSSPEKLAKALRANLKRRKGPTGQYGLEDGRAAKRAPEANAQQRPDEGRPAKRVPERRPAQTSARPFEKPLKISG